MCPQAFYFGRKVLKRKGLFGSTHKAQDEVRALLKWGVPSLENIAKNSTQKLQIMNLPNII